MMMTTNDKHYHYILQTSQASLSKFKAA